MNLTIACHANCNRKNQRPLVWSNRKRVNKTLLILKLSAFFLLATTCLQLSAKGFSEISIKEKNESLQKVLTKIQKQSGYDFIYAYELIQGAGKVSVSFKNVSLERAMDECLRGKDLVYEIVEKTVVIKKKAIIPSINLSVVPDKVVLDKIKVEGKVVNENGEPLAGVAVVIMGTAKGITTDVNGTFSIDANTGDMLEVSAIGFAVQKITIGVIKTLTIQLVPKNNELEEVVVVGLGNKQKKISVVGALSTISTKELKQSPVSNLSNALAGRLPGLITVQSSNEPGAGSALHIRGISTMTVNTAPLFVIDGLPRSGGDFSQIDPSEVESVTILKDASSTALYGIQGANGVVIVTTKRGKLNQKPEINFTAQYAQQQPIRLPQMMSAYDLALWDNEANNTTIWNDADLAIIKAGTNPYTYPDVNWFDYLLKDKASQQQYNINFMGGSKFAKYFVSGSYVNQGSLFDHEDENVYGVQTRFNRYNFRSNIDIQVNERLNLQVDMAGRLEERSGPGAGIGAVFQILNRLIPNMTAVFNPNGSIAHGGKVFVPSDNHNPYGALTRSGYYNNYANAMYGTFAVIHKLDFILPGLSTQLLFTFQNNSNRNTTRGQNYDSYWYRGLDAGGVPIYQKIRSATSLATTGSAAITRNNYTDFRINYDRTFNKHAITAQILGNRTLSIEDAELPYAYQGISSRATYGYDNKYFAEINVGYNGSENFPKGNRYGLFPAFTAGWVVTNENFFADNNVIRFLKIRASYGLVGNDKVGGSRWLYISDFAPTAAGSSYNFGFTPGSLTGYNENRVGNTNVTWERATKMNIGMDATLLNGFAKITFDLFKEERSNILLTSGTVPTYIGISNLAPINAGKVVNSGFEVELQLNKKFGPHFNIFSTLQVTYARNKVLENDQPNLAFQYQDLRNYEIGYQLGYKAIGIFKDQKEIDNSPVQTLATVFPGDIKYLDVNKDGFVDAGDRIPIQIHNVPRYVFGGSLGASYKGFDFSFMINGAWGATTNLGSTSFDNILRGRKIWEQRWSPTNNENPILPSSRRTSNNTPISSFWLASGDYIKLRNAEIGYELPSTLLKRIKLKFARIFLTGQNLAVWDQLWVKEQDPESAGTTTGYPAQRIINIGINIRL